jgi:hypothetical protein
LNRTPASAGNRKTFTISCWIKRGKLDSAATQYTLFNSYGSGDDSGYLSIYFYQDILRITGWSTLWRATTQVFRDISAWCHIVISVDTTQATADNRIRVYINGSEITSFSTKNNPSQNLDLAWNNSTVHHLGADAYVGPNQYIDGYLAEIYNIDGQALTPSSFGETDAITGRWKAKAYSGTYGTNGFYLKFADNSGATATTLGKDSSGNGNNWTPNNFSVTSGAGNDSLVDSPTNYGSGTSTVGNFCTWNPLINGDSASNGNLDVTNDTARGNHELMKYDAYWEVTATGGTCLAGIISTAATSTITVGSAKTFGFKLSEAGVFEYANITDGSSFTSQATATTPPFPYASTGASITASINCGQRAFAGTLPLGYKPICTTSLDKPTIQKPSTAMDVVTYTGTGASQSISSLGFSPDLVWIKGRSGATDHALYDVIRGSQARLESNTTDAEATSDNGLTSFDSSGFTIGTLAQVNTNTATYVGWSWDAGSTNSTNTAGSITSTVRANPQAGFSIVSWTDDTSTNNRVGHGLGIVPKIVIYKPRSASGYNWNFWTTIIDGSNDVLYLNLTNAKADISASHTSPTSTTISNYGSWGGATMIAYCFAEIEGYSKFGSYTGNGSSDGPFVWCGFRPRYVLIKRTDSTGDWNIIDTSRSIFNQTNNVLWANLSDADAAGQGTDILSNGFKLRSNGLVTNASNGNFIFAAFAESPFKYAKAR